MSKKNKPNKEKEPDKAPKYPEHTPIEHPHGQPADEDNEKPTEHPYGDSTNEDDQTPIEHPDGKSAGEDVQTPSEHPPVSEQPVSDIK